ncbi:MAG: TolC family protein [Cyclobacteriaceae bacterium]|nr:TolC family protein [Cyclobacteriaceae bacterium]
MNKFKIIPVVFLVGLCLFFQSATGQRKLTLEDVVIIAIEQSPAAKRAETRKENRYWMYRTFKSNYVPQLQLSGTLPGFTRAFSRIQQNNGTFAYRFQNQNTAELELSLQQTIAATGGRVFMSSSLERFDNFLDGEHSYRGDPVSVGFFQPLFGFNALKWDQKIEPLRYEESKREYAEEFEQISERASQLFFDLLTAQISLGIAEINVASNDTIYKIAQGRYELGIIPENELLQLELSLMNSRQSVAQSQLNLGTATLRLKSYLGFQENETIELIEPAQIPEFDVQESIAIEMAQQNRSDAIRFERLKLEADMDVAEAIGTGGLNASLFGRAGLSNSGLLIPEVYEKPDNQVIANLGFTIPILDWGRQEARRRTAEANQQLVQFTVQQDVINFKEEVITQVRRFKMLRDQVAIASKADEISQKRYSISKNRYLIGKTSITDLSLALTEKDRAKQDYLTSLGNFWQAYYQLRQLTLYDFSTGLILFNPDLE